MVASRKHIVVWLAPPALAALLTGLWFLGAWLGSDHWLWVVGAVLCALALAGSGYAVFAGGRKAERPGGLALGFSFLAGVVWAFSGLIHTHAVVHVENGTAELLVVELDGRHWLTVVPGGGVAARLPRGAHHVTVRSEGGEPRDDRDVTVGDHRAYVLNLLGARTYHRGSVLYSSAPGPALFPLGTNDITDVWFDAEVDFLFSDPPRTVPVSRHTTWTIRSYLKRGPGPKATPRAGVNPFDPARPGMVPPFSRP